MQVGCRVGKGIPIASRGLNIFLSALLIFSFFPWLSFRLLPLDTQPWPLLVLLSILLTTFLCWDIQKPLFILLGITIIFMFSIFMELRLDFLTIRAIATYFAIFVSFSAYFVYKTRVGSPLKIIYAANIIWLISGTLQQIFGPYFLDWMVEVRTTATRGVTGLAPEATFYGIALFFLSWLIVIEAKKLRVFDHLIILMNFIFVILIAKSTMAFLFYIAAIPIAFFFQRPDLRRGAAKVFTLLAVLASGYVVTRTMSDARIGNLISRVVRDPMAVVLLDDSINARMQHAVLPFYISALHFGVPQGTHGFREEREKILGDFGGLIQLDRGDREKIMSASGTLIFEQGVLVFLLIGFLFRWVLPRNNREEGLPHIVIWGMLSVSAIPLAFPPFWFVWASLAANRWMSEHAPAGFVRCGRAKR